MTSKLTDERIEGELKLCPLCGLAAARKVDDDTIKCRFCGVIVSYRNAPENIWNGRPLEGKLLAEVHRLQGELAKTNTSKDPYGMFPCPMRDAIRESIEQIPEEEYQCQWETCYGGMNLAGAGFCLQEDSNPRDLHCKAYRQLCTHCGGEGLEPVQQAGKE